MKSLRIALITGLALVAAAAPALAQRGPRMGGGPGWGGRGPQRRSMLLQGITLTDAQRVRIDSIHAAAPIATGVPRASGDSAVRAQRRAAAAERQAAVRAVLTPDQQAVWDRNVLDVRARQQHLRAGRAQLRADVARMRAGRARMRADRAWMGWHHPHRW
jgi:Spy/CpxP family protein refolding chaperone